MNAVLATLLEPTASEFRCTHLEMMKGITGHGFYDNMVVPIIENTARECELTGRMRAAMEAYPKSSAVLVRRHGVYVWGKNWIEAKTQAECYDYLFGIAVKMAGLGIDASRAPAAIGTLNNGKSIMQDCSGSALSTPPAFISLSALAVLQAQSCTFARGAHRMLAYIPCST
jgi:methylthioribulose 1-phosphate dehydratase / enolase-phosphatase E1